MPKKIEKPEVVEKVEPVEKPEAVERPPATKLVELTVPFFLNGRKYGPGLCEVPTDAFHLWKGCV